MGCTIREGVRRQFGGAVLWCLGRVSEGCVCPAPLCGLLSTGNDASSCWQEYEHRFAVWLDNLKFIIEYNSKVTSHWVRANEHQLLNIFGFL